MTDVTTYEIGQKVRLLEGRVERIEQDRLKELEERAERMRQKNDAFMRWSLFGIILVAAVAWTVVIMLAVVER